MNYSRGALYYAMQPFWHTGVRANFRLHDAFALNAMVVNGVNNAFENNKSPSLGVRACSRQRPFTLAAGYLGALNPRNVPEGPTETSRTSSTWWRPSPAAVQLVGNFDFNAYKRATEGPRELVGA